jgi:hypothetical protein
MITHDKVIEIFSLADDFYKIFNHELATCLIQPERTKRQYSRKSTMSDSEYRRICLKDYLLMAYNLLPRLKRI